MIKRRYGIRRFEANDVTGKLGTSAAVGQWLRLWLFPRKKGVVPRRAGESHAECMWRSRGFQFPPNSQESGQPRRNAGPALLLTRKLFATSYCTVRYHLVHFSPQCRLICCARLPYKAPSSSVLAANLTIRLTHTRRLAVPCV